MIGDTSFKSNVLEFMGTYNKINQFSFKPNSSFWTNIGTIKLPDSDKIHPLKIELLYGTTTECGEFISNNIHIIFYSLQNSCKFDRFSNKQFAVCSAYNIIKQGENHIDIACVQVDFNLYQFWFKFNIGGGTCSIFIYDDYKFTLDGKYYFRLPEDYPILQVCVKNLALQDNIDEIINNIVYDASSNCYIKVQDSNNNVLREQLHKLHNCVDTLECNLRMIKTEIVTKACKTDINCKADKNQLDAHIRVMDSTLVNLHNKLCEKASLEELLCKADIHVIENKVDKTELENIIKLIYDKLDCKLNTEDKCNFVKYDTLTELLKKVDADNTYFKKCDIDKKILECIVSRNFTNPDELYELLNNTIIYDCVKRTEFTDTLKKYTHEGCNLYTKDDIDNLLCNKFDKSECYTRFYLDKILNNKINNCDLSNHLCGNYYTKDYIDDNICNKITCISGEINNCITSILRVELIKLQDKLQKHLLFTDISSTTSDYNTDEINALLLTINEKLLDLSSNNITICQISNIYEFIQSNYNTINHCEAIYHVVPIINEKLNALSSYIDDVLKDITISGTPLDLSNYYDKTYLNSIITTLTNNISRIDTTLSSNIPSLSSVITLSNNYNTLSANYNSLNLLVNTLSSTITTTNTNINQSLSSNYYDKTYLNSIITTLTNNISRIDNTLSSVNTINALSSTITILNSDTTTLTTLSNSISILTEIITLSSSIPTLSSIVMLTNNNDLLTTNYNNLNSIVNTLSSSVTTISDTLLQLSNTLSSTIDDTNKLITQTLSSNYYTISEVISTISDKITPITTSITDINTNKATLNNPTFSGTVTLPVNTLYKNKLLLSYSTIEIYYKDAGSGIYLNKCIVDTTINSSQSEWLYNNTSEVVQAGFVGIDISVNADFILPKVIYCNGFAFKSITSTTYDVNFIVLSTSVSSGTPIQYKNESILRLCSNSQAEFNSDFGIKPTFVKGIFHVATIFLLY